MSWDIVCFNDSNDAGDSVTRKSVSVIVLCVLGMPASWQSKAQESLTLSSSESEWVVLSEAVNKGIFVVKLLQCMKILVKVPTMVQ